MKVKVNAKINIGLKVTGTAGDLHTLDGLFHSIDLCDEFDFSGKEIVVKDMTGEIELERYKKYLVDLLAAHNIDGGVKVVKRIPLGGGLGGGSTASVAVAAYLEKSGKRVGEKFLKSLGSDVPFMFKGGFARVKGTGDEISFLPPLKRFALLVKVGTVSTKDAFRLCDETEREKFSITDVLENLILDSDNFAVPNDLYKAAVKLNGKIEDVFEFVNRYGCPCFMSGSGSTIVALSDKKEKLSKIENDINSVFKNSEKLFKKIVKFDKIGKSAN